VTSLCMFPVVDKRMRLRGYFHSNSRRG
jgi:hypothetical protein